jgi:hypothetical protein
VSGRCSRGPQRLEAVCTALERVGCISEESSEMSKPKEYDTKQLETIFKQYIPQEHVPPKLASPHVPSRPILPRQTTLASA